MDKLGEAYELGRGVGVDRLLAMSWYGKAAERGHVSAMSFVAASVGAGRGAGVRQAARRAVEGAALGGRAEAMGSRGRRLRVGEGTTVAALSWLRKGAELGSPEAMVGHGGVLSNGGGEDRRAAVMWWRKAAAMGHIAAMEMLSRAYANGLGVERNVEAAEAWRRKAESPSLQ
jgi:hypothetical protein